MSSAEAAPKPAEDGKTVSARELLCSGVLGRTGDDPAACLSPRLRAPSRSCARLVPACVHAGSLGSGCSRVDCVPTVFLARFSSSPVLRARAAAGGAGAVSTDKSTITVGTDGLIIESNAAATFESFDEMGLKEELLRGIYGAERSGRPPPYTLFTPPAPRS